MQTRAASADHGTAENNCCLSIPFILSLYERQNRDQTGLFLAEGLRFFHSASASPDNIAGVVICPKRLQYAQRIEIEAYCQCAKIPIRRIDPDQLSTISNSPEPQGVILVCRQKWQSLPESTTNSDRWLGIENIQTSGNLGTLMRSAAAFGASGLMVLGPQRDRSDPYDPTCVRASMGAVFQLNVVETHHKEYRKWSRLHKVLTIGASCDGTETIDSIDPNQPISIMLGNERKGLSGAQRSTCDRFVHIPLAPNVDSLNVAMAGTVLLYETSLVCRKMQISR